MTGLETVVAEVFPVICLPAVNVPLFRLSVEGLLVAVCLSRMPDVTLLMALFCILAVPAVPVFPDTDGTLFAPAVLLAEIVRVEDSLLSVTVLVSELLLKPPLVVVLVLVKTLSEPVWALRPCHFPGPSCPPCPW